MKTKTGLLLALAIFFQLQVLVGMQVLSALPLWTGTEVRVHTRPVDPRSMFRGNYARLRYNFTDVRYSDLGIDRYLRNGEEVYVLLEEGADGTFTFAGASLEKPSDGTFLRGRVASRTYRYRLDAKPPGHWTVNIHFGLEAFFAPKEEALALERELRSGAVAVLMVDSSGNARIKEIVTAAG